MDALAATAKLPLRFEIEWDTPSAIAVPEFDVTWCNLQVWVGHNCITRVDSADSGVRKGIRTSVYPLAEWVARNWWALTQDLRPSSEPTVGWGWLALDRLPWLPRHNTRAAGDGMPWPDLTIVPEGSVTTLRWLGGPGVAGQPIRFLETGIEHVSSAEVERSLRRLVQQVIERLDEAGIATTLHEVWQATIELDAGEAEFARAAAKLGLDPFAVPEAVADELIAVSNTVSGGLLDEFLDSADPSNLRGAARWLEAAREALKASTGRNSGTSIARLRAHQNIPTSEEMPAFRRGYALARQVRHELGLASDVPFAIEDWVSAQPVHLPSAGLQGLVASENDDRVALALPTRVAEVSGRFAQARALGLALTGDRSEYLLDPTRSDLMKVARAFAAELLAPATGITEMLSSLRYPNDDAIDQIASAYVVSPLVIKHQYDNQVPAGSRW